MSTSLIIGAGGFVGSCYAEHLVRGGHRPVRVSRRTGLDVVLSTPERLDATLVELKPDQVVVTAQLSDPSTGWILDRIDGPRWLVLSTSQLGSAVPAPGHDQAVRHEKLARGRGALVVRPTMIFGRGRDLNVTRLLRQISRFRFAVQVGGGQLVQPLHVDDLCALMERHLVAVETRRPGALVEVGGSEQLSVAELLDSLEQLARARGPRLVLPMGVVVVLTRLAGLFGLRSDQVSRLVEDKVVALDQARDLFSWEPVALGVRLEQAYLERAYLEQASLERGPTCAS